MHGASDHDLIVISTIPLAASHLLIPRCSTWNRRDLQGYRTAVERSKSGMVTPATYHDVAMSNYVQGQGDAAMHTSGRGRGDEVGQPRGRGRGEAVEQQRGGAGGDAVMKLPGRGRGQAAKSRQRHGVPKTGSYGAAQEGAVVTKRQQKAEEGVPTPRTGTSRAEQAPRTEASGDKPGPNATDSIIRGGSSSTSRRTPDWIIRGQRAAKRTRLEHSGWNRQQEPPNPLHEIQGTRGGQTPRTGASGAEREGVATTTGAWERWFAAPGRNARGRSTGRGPHPPARSVQGTVAARGEGNRRPRP